MKIKSMMSIKAIVVIFFGLGFLNCCHFLWPWILVSYPDHHVTLRDECKLRRNCCFQAAGTNVYSDRFIALVMQEHN